MLSIVFWSIYVFVLAQNYETFGIQMRAVPVLLQFCFCFVLRETQCGLFVEIIMFILLKRESLLQDI